MNRHKDFFNYMNTVVSRKILSRGVTTAMQYSKRNNRKQAWRSVMVAYMQRCLRVSCTYVVVIFPTAESRPLEENERAEVSPTVAALLRGTHGCSSCCRRQGGTRRTHDGRPCEGIPSAAKWQSCQFLHRHSVRQGPNRSTSFPGAAACGAVVRCCGCHPTVSSVHPGRH